MNKGELAYILSCICVFKGSHITDSLHAEIMTLKIKFRTQPPKQNCMNYFCTTTWKITVTVTSGYSIHQVNCNQILLSLKVYLQA